MLHSDKLHQAIAALEAQQRDLGLDFTQQTASCSRAWRHGRRARWFWRIATTGGAAAGAGGVAVRGDLAGNVFIGSTVNISAVVIPARRPATPVKH